MHAAVLGSPVSHSLSPCIHNAGYVEAGLTHDYRAIDVTVDSFQQFVESLNSEWMGLSLTMPLKEIAFEVAHDVTQVALLARSINTLIMGDTIVADNTDVVGIVNAVRECTDVALQHMLLIGSGATARSALVAASQLGVTKVDILARNVVAIEECTNIATQLNMSLHEVSAEQATTSVHSLTINTTPAGVADSIAGLIANPRGVLLDVVYHPWPTALAQRWESEKLRTVPGYLMLLHQAVRQFEMMTQTDAPLDAMRNALMAELSKRGQL